MPNLQVVSHHYPPKRQPCHDCSVRVFVYSTDEHNLNRCNTCTMRYNRTPVCWCGRPLALADDGTTPVHADGKRYGHPATLETQNPAWQTHKTEEPVWTKAGGL